MPGHSLKSPGRPPRETERRVALEMTTRIRERVSDEDWDEIIDRTKDDAKKGNVYARNWLTEHLIGRTAMNIPLNAVGQKMLSEMIMLFKELGMQPEEGLSSMVSMLQHEVEKRRKAEGENIIDVSADAS